MKYCQLIRCWAHRYLIVFSYNFFFLEKVKLDYLDLKVTRMFQNVRDFPSPTMRLYTPLRTLVRHLTIPAFAGKF